MFWFFFSSRRRHTRYIGDWSSDVCSPIWAEDAYRDGEHLHTRVGTRGGILAKSVEVTAGSPVRGASETWIPIRWEATGAPSLFPSLEADVVAAYVGASLTQIALRGTYQAPFGRVGEALDRALLHRIAEASATAS